MSTPEEKPHIVITDSAEVGAIYESFNVMGLLDYCDIYEIQQSDGTTVRLLLGDELRDSARQIMLEAYPGCVATLLSAGERPPKT